MLTPEQRAAMEKLQAANMAAAQAMATPAAPPPLLGSAAAGFTAAGCTAAERHVVTGLGPQRHEAGQRITLTGLNVSRRTSP